MDQPLMSYPMPDRVPPPSHRHAAPCGPWPWIDDDHEEDGTPSTPPARCNHPGCNDCNQWLGYPQSHFPNWTPRQIERSRIAGAIRAQDRPCTVHSVDVKKDGKFVVDNPERPVDNTVEFWRELKGRVVPSSDEQPHVRALFVENLSGKVLQMLGARYNIEPFFFSSSLNWIPSRFQEDLHPGVKDHLTITLIFPRAQKAPASTGMFVPYKGPRVIDAQAPLPLTTNNKILLLDLCSIHMVRGPETSTMISYHPLQKSRTTARRLQTRVQHAGNSVYWQHIWGKSHDPTFVLLATLWHALYAWDEALEALYDHFCELESRVMHSKSLDLTQELYVLRAHLMHWSSLLDDFGKSVQFVLDTPYPAMTPAAMSNYFDEEQCKFSRAHMEKECGNMLTEIDRLKKSRGMQEKRLKNVMNLVFASVNIEDSRQMQGLTRAAVRDSSTMKLISFLTMLYLPGSFVATAFGMNVREINPSTPGSVRLYFATMVPLTFLTVWIVMAVQSKYSYPDPERVTFWTRVTWPVVYGRQMLTLGAEKKSEV